MSDTIHVPARAVAAAAQALWGASWQSAMAKALKLDLRRVQRMAAAARDDLAYPIPRALLEDLLRKIEKQHFPLQQAYEDLKLIYDRA